MATKPILPDYTRWQWASVTERDWWRPLFAEASNAFQALELLSVVHGLRPAAWQFVSADQLVAKMTWAQQQGLVALPTSFVQDTGQYSSQSHGRGIPNTYRVVFTTPDRAKDVYPWTDNDKIGDLLGFPACCRKAFAETWGAGQVDSTYEQLRDSVVIAHQHTMLRWMGIRLVPHMPCNFDCPHSLDMADQFFKLGVAHGYKEQMWLMREVLNWNFTWSRLFGNAEITTPALKILTRSDWTPTKQTFGRGNQDTYNKPDATLWTDNGFTNPAAMRTAHDGLLNSLRELPPGARIADLGCGNGLLLRRLTIHRPDIKIGGIDSNKDAIARIPALTGRFGTGRIESRIWTASAPTAVLINPLRLLEMTPTDAARTRESFTGRQVYLYAYPDSLKDQSLEALAAAAGLGTVRMLQKTPDVSVGLLT